MRLGVALARRVPWLSAALPASRGPIGLDVDADGVHAVQLERDGDVIRLRALCACGGPVLDRSRPTGDPDPATLRAALRGARFRGRRAVTALGGDGVKLMVLNYEPEGERDEAEQILRLVEERIPEPLEECVIDYLPIRAGAEGRAERSALVAVAARVRVIEHLELLRHAGLEVESLEIAPVAVRRLVTWLMREHTGENLLVLHTGTRRTAISVFWGRRLILYREIEFGEDALVASLAQGLELEPAAAHAVLREYGFHGDGTDARLVPDGPSADEIRRTLREILKADLHRLGEAVRSALVYTASRTRGGSVEELRVLGSAIGWLGVERLLSELLGLRVARLDPFAALGARPEDAAAATVAPDRIAVAAGCALRGLAHGA